MSVPRIGDRPRWIITLRFTAQEGEVRGALIAVDTALDVAGVARELRDRTQIALAEACNNIVEHAYAGVDPATDPTITLEVASDRGGLQITLRDRGVAMPGGAIPRPDMPIFNPADPDDLPEGGFGWPLLRGMARALSLSRKNGQNILRFRLPMVEASSITGRNAM